MIRIKFETDEGLKVVASCKDIGCYQEAEDLRISVWDDRGDQVYPDYESMCEIEEESLAILYDRKYHGELEFG